MAEPSKLEAIELVEAGLADAEAAIRKHSPETVELYERGIAGIREARRLNPPGQALIAHLESVGITLDQYEMIRRYLLSTGFMSAWYHRQGDKARRDQAAHSAATLVVATGLEKPEAVFAILLDHEQMWRQAFDEHGIGRKAGMGCAPILVFTAAVGAGVAFR